MPVGTELHFLMQNILLMEKRERKTECALIANIRGRMESFLCKLFTLFIQLTQRMHLDRAQYSQGSAGVHLVKHHLPQEVTLYSPAEDTELFRPQG